MSVRDFAWFSACDRGRRTDRTQILYESYDAGLDTTEAPASKDIAQ